MEHGTFRKDTYWKRTFLSRGGLAVRFTRSCVQKVSYASHQAGGHSRSGLIRETLLSSSQQGKKSLRSYSPQTEGTALGGTSPTTPQLTVDF